MTGLMDGIDSSVKKILERDIEFKFKIIATEIGCCNTRQEMERIVDEYVLVMREEIKRQIIEKNQRFK